MFETTDSRMNNILLVEQDSLQSGEVRQALVESGVAGRLHRVAGIQDAIAYLRRDAPYFAAPRPNIVLLGCGVRLIDADQLTRELDRNPSLNGICVLEIITDSDVCTADDTAATCIPLEQLGDAIAMNGSSS